MRLFFNLINAMIIRAHYLYEDVIEKSVPSDHCLSPLSKPRDAYQCSSVQIFLFHPYNHDGYFYSLTTCLKNGNAH